MNKFFILALITLLYFNTVQSAVSAAQFKNKMLSKHNTLRTKTANGNTPGQPAAKKNTMKKLKWDTKLAKVAQGWANQCKWYHNKNAGDQYGKKLVAENLYSSSGYKLTVNNLVMSVTEWYNEYKYFNFQNGVNTANSQNGHYAIMMEAQATKLGCAYKQCNKLVDENGQVQYQGKQALIVVCNYWKVDSNGSPYIQKGASAFTYDDGEGTGLSSTEIAAVILCSVGCICFVIIAGLLYIKRRKKTEDIVMKMKEEVNDVEKDDDDDLEADTPTTPGKKSSIDVGEMIVTTTTPSGNDNGVEQQEIEIEAYLENVEDEE